jgi:hypothetical protein
MAGNAPHIPGCRDLSLIGERVARSLFSATSDRVGRPVTITVFPPLSEGRTRPGFDQAAATAQRLGAHPSVLTIHEWGHASDGRPWVVTDPQPADSVDTLLTLDGPLEVERALQVGVLVAGALETAHRAGIVHGDLSPARLVFGPQGEPLLAETGLAPFAVLPGLGALNNPVRYHAPPEVLERTDIGPATDVYSLGTTVYALLAGRAPQQKPAQVTDSNASLLLRILQMSVPPIGRHDLPPGLEDALRGPLSANPDKRPQQAIDVAWLLQDVQRRAAWAVTEPVVLDLDDLEGAVRPARAGSAAAWSGPAAPAESSSSVSPIPPMVAPLPVVDEPTVSDTWAPVAASALPPASAPEAPADPEPFGDPDPFTEPDLPAPTIFPFAEGLDAAPTNGTPAAPLWPGGETSAASPEAPWPGTSPTDPPADTPWSSAAPSTPPADPPADTPWSSAAPSTPTSEPPAETLWPGAAPSTPPADPPADALWSSAAPTEGAGSSLWPSTWPADAPPAESPTSPSPPVDFPPPGLLPPAGAGAGPLDAAPGDDGGSIGDAAPMPFGHGNGDSSAPAPSFGVSERPPELDELPSWYTDPLPNAGDRASTNGGTSAGNGNGHLPGSGFAPPPWASSTPGSPPAPAPSPPSSAPSPPSSAASPSDQERLPGAGDELRSLFGEVVRDPEPELPSRSSVFPDAVPAEPDPLGPPSDRPPIDLSRLDAPLGPSPYLPSARDRTGADGAGQAPKPRLPRRHEVPGTQGADGADSQGPPRLPRAGEAPTGRDVGGRPALAERPTRLERPPPRQVAPVEGAQGPSTSGPPALPLIILIGVLAVLVLGAAWLIITGDEAEPPASERPSAEGDAAPDAAPAVPTGVQATPVPEGINVTWTGAEDISYVVTVMSADQPPTALPPTLGTSVLVPNVELGPAGAAGGRCFTVAAVAGPEAPPGTPSPPACTPGATVEGMVPAA